MEDKTPRTLNEFLNRLYVSEARLVEVLTTRIQKETQAKNTLQKEAHLDSVRREKMLNTISQFSTLMNNMVLSVEKVSTHFASSEMFKRIHESLNNPSVQSAIVNMAKQKNGIYKPRGVESFPPPLYRPAPNQHLVFEKTLSAKILVSNKLEELKHRLGLEYQGFLLEFEAHLIRPYTVNMC